MCLAFSVLEGTFSSSEASSNYFLVSRAASSCLVVFSDNGSSSSVDSFFSLEASSTFSLVDQDGSFSSEVFLVEAAVSSAFYFILEVDFFSSQVSLDINFSILEVSFLVVSSDCCSVSQAVSSSSVDFLADAFYTLEVGFLFRGLFQLLFGCSGWFFLRSG